MQKFPILLMAIVVTTLLSCRKSQNDVSINSSPDLSVVSETAETSYGNLTCTMPDGSSGCECTQAYDEDCELETECTSSSELANYDAALHAMFDETAIQYRAQNNVRITEPQLIDALILDGWPLIQE